MFSSAARHGALAAATIHRHTPKCTQRNICLFSPAAGSLPSEWSALAAAQSIDVSGNSLTGALPASWSSLSQLQVPRSAKQSGRSFS